MAYGESNGHVTLKGQGRDLYAYGPVSRYLLEMLFSNNRSVDSLL